MDCSPRLVALGGDFVLYDPYEGPRVSEAQARLGYRVPLSPPEGYRYTFQYIEKGSDAQIIAYPSPRSVDMTAITGSEVDGSGEDGQSHLA